MSSIKSILTTAALVFSAAASAQFAVWCGGEAQYTMKSGTPGHITMWGNFIVKDANWQDLYTSSSAPDSVTFYVPDAKEEEKGDEGGDTESDFLPDAKTVVSKIYAGVNIGNTMECTSGGEGSWSGAKVNETYIKGLKALGFNAVRIPCAWNIYASGSDYKISATWLARVKEVVGWCISNDMYVVLNCHWDGGWLEDNIFNASKQTSIAAEQKALWTQIANAMKEFDGHLVFAGCNEPGMNETSGNSTKWKDATAITRLVLYEQTFIDAVRATGGNNAKRCLVFQGLGTDIANTSDYMTTLPTDQVADRLIAEVHYYEPYQWALMETDASWGKVFYYWGKDNHKTGSAHNPTWGEEDWVKSQFAKMKTKFVDNGIPVILGEYSARIQTKSTDSETFDKDLHDKSRAYYNEVVTREAKNYGIAPFYWETNGDINRSNGTAKNAYAIDGIMKGAAAGTYPY